MASPPGTLTPRLDHLILVCCHAHHIPSQDPLLESSWHLKPFQRSQIYSPGHFKQGEHLTFAHHVLAGHSLSLSSPSSLLIFSGGATDPLTPDTEGGTYLAALRALLPADRQPGRCTTEDDATDSYQNLLFSVLRFHSVTGRWPERISVVTHAFKAPRFLRCHAPVIVWPSDRIEVIGIDPVWACEAEKVETLKGEERAVAAFREDPYGVRGTLAEKRKGRRWDGKVLDGLVEGLEGSVQRLVRWDRTEMFDEMLPWSSESARYPAGDGDFHMESVELEKEYRVTTAPCTRIALNQTSKHSVSS